MTENMPHSEDIKDDEIYKQYENQVSFTNLGGLGGNPFYNNTISGFPSSNKESEGYNIYGAQFKTIKDYPTPQNPYFETEINVTVEPPWLGRHVEGTFMNNLKDMQEPPEKTYKELELSAIPLNNYEEYEPIIYTVEGFGEKDKDIKTLFVGIIIFAFFIFIIFFKYKLNIFKSK